MRRLTHLSTLTLSLALFAGFGLTLSACSDDAASNDEALGSDDGLGTEGGDWGDEAGETGDGAGDDGGPDEPTPDDSAETDTDTDTDTGGEPVCNDVDDVVLYLSPDDSNSMSSPAQIRETVLGNGSTNINYVPIRTWEFMNYYDFDYAAAVDGELALSAAMELVDDPELMADRYRLQIAVSSEDMSEEERPPMNVTLVLDTSGSMSGEPIDLLKESCRVIASKLRAGDKVSVVEWDTENSYSLAGYAVMGPDDPTLLDVIDNIQAGGGTDLNGGLTSGYDLAQMTWDVNALNRLVLISDGGANAGVTDVDIIAENAVYGGADGIYLVGVGVGDGGGYNDQLMDEVTDAGKGASVFIGDEAEAAKTFGDRFINTMGLAARNVQVELVMPPGFEIVKFSGEEYSGDPQEIEPQHIAPNDDMVFHQQIETCAPELAGLDAEVMVTASWEDIATFESKETSRTYTIGELLEADNAQLLKGAAILAYTDALKAYKAGAPEPEMSDAQAAVSAAQALLVDDPDLDEIAQILNALGAN